VNELSRLIHQRASLADEIRAFFNEIDVIEVTTALLSQAAVTDPGIESFTVTVSEKEVRYLRTSPEFSLKRLLGAGTPDVFELGPVFRNGERGSLHNPEFTLLEWYRQGVVMQGLIDEVVTLIQRIRDGKFSQFRVHQHRYYALFDSVTGCNVRGYCAAELKRLAVDLTQPPNIDMDTDQWLDFLFSTLIQPSFDSDTIHVVTHYPASQAALAKIDPDAPDTALRFEVFVGAVELANGFEELNNAAEQAERFARDNVLRDVRGQKQMPVDRRFIQTLDQLPACSGVALGFDRLLMLADDLPSISKALLVGWFEA